MKILIGYDGSPEAVNAVELSIRHAKAFHGSVDVITSFKRGEDSQIEDLEAATQALERIKKHFEQAGIACKTHLLIQGRTPGEDLVEFAEHHGVDEIIVGVRKKSRVEKLLIGSTAQYVILEARCPVVGVK